MKYKGVMAAVAVALAGGVVLGSAGTAMAKTTVELTADRQTVRPGESVTFTAVATTDPTPAPKNLRACLQTLVAHRGYVPSGRCVPVTKRPHGTIDIFIVKVTLQQPGQRTFRALAITPDGQPWTAPSRPVTITIP